MFYDAELRFLQAIFKKHHLQSLLLRAEAPIPETLDLGLRRHLGLEADYSHTLSSAVQLVQPNTICKLTDQFLCSYVFLLLPEINPSTILAIGPYLAKEVTREQLLERAEHIGVCPHQFPHLEHYYSGIPVLAGHDSVFAPLEAFGALIWRGSEAYTVADINPEFPAPHFLLPLKPDETAPGDRMRNIQLLENRYHFENELMQAVSRGQTHKGERILAVFSELSFERRLADPVRNLKNYCIIMNTLFRKAAESGGVHPVHLDSMSSGFAHKVEALVSPAAARDLMKEMFRSYCHLVKRSSTRHYSPPVQKTLVYIDSDLSGDLSLKALAKLQNINASYLSALFRKETGQTITDYVNQKRVQMATQLLNTTKLQVQTIAQHCGIHDVNYFSKLFKKYTQKTPKEYRKESQSQTGTKRAL